MLPDSTPNASRPNPYVGPRSFRANERLYGRDAELLELLDLLIAERIVLLYSPSGAGKTSLIQAALVPALAAEGFVVHPPLRVSQTPPAGEVAGANRYLLSLLLSLEDEREDAPPRSAGELAQMTLVEYLDARSAAQGDANEVFIFDQFEEILTLDPVDKEAKVAFFQQVGDALRTRRPGQRGRDGAAPGAQRWALFSMREEFIAGLDPYLRPIPTRLSNTFRLELLGVNGALEAVRRPAAAVNPPVDFTPAAAHKLIDDLRMVRTQDVDGAVRETLGPFVEPVQLQVVCRRLWEHLEPDDIAIDVDDIENVGDVDTALRGYYRSSVENVASQTSTRERTIRDWAERQLITRQGVRGQVQQSPDRSNGLENAVIWKLVDTHLIRAEERRQITWFELAHDRLIEPVLADNAQWRDDNLSLLQRQAELWRNEGRPDGLLLQGQALVEAERWAAAHPHEMEEHEREFLQAAQKERRRQHVQRLMLIAISIFAVMAVISAFITYQAQQREQIAKETALTKEAEAVIARNTAEAARAQEEIARVAAETARAVAIAAEATAVAERNQALTNESRLLAKEAQGQLIRDPVASLQLALAALPSAAQPRPYAPSAELALAQGVRSSLERKYLKLSAQPLTAAQVARQPGGEVAAVGGDALRLVKLDLTEVVTLATTETEFAHVAWSADGSQMVSLETVSQGSLSNRTMRVWRNNREVTQHTFDEPIGCAEWAPDGSHIAICSGKAVWLWSVDDEAPPYVIADKFSQNTIGVQWSSDGRWLAAWGELDTLMIWDQESGRPFYKHNQENIKISAATWVVDNNDELFLAAIYGNGAVWLVSSSEAASTAVPEAPESGATFSGLQKIDDAHFITWGSSTVSRVWANEEVTGDFGQATDNIQGIALSPAGTKILAFLANGSAKLWDISPSREFTQTQSLQGSPVILSGHTGTIRSAAWDASGKYIATTSIDGTARVWDAATGKSLSVLRGHTNLDSQAATAEVIGAFWVGDRFLTTYGEDGSFRLWEVFDAHGQPIACPEQISPNGAACLEHTQLFKAHRRAVQFARWLDDDTILSADGDGVAAHLDLKTGRAATLESDDWEYPVIVWNPSGDQVLTYEELDDEPEQTKSEIREFATGESINAFDFPIAKAVWLDDVLVLGGESEGVRLYDPASFELRAELPGSHGALTAAALSPHKLLAAGFLQGDVYIWDLADAAALEPIAHYAPQNALETWSVMRLDWGTDKANNEDQLLIIGERSVVLWSVSVDTVALRAGSDVFADAALSPDGLWLAVADSRNVRILNASDGALAMTLPEHTDTVQGVAWTWGAEWPHQTDAPAADQRLLLLTWSDDGTARVWDWPRRQQIDLLYGDLLYGDGSLNLAAFSPNRERILTAASSGALRVWDVWVQRPAALYATACGLVTRPLLPAQVVQFALAALPTLGCATAAE
ncbi:MAG: hypothetical protein R3A44_43515 [Caldilineaceae bacterium]